MMRWNDQLVDQLDWHWQHQLRDRLGGLTDEEYFWEPVSGAWSIRPRDTASINPGAGAWMMDRYRSKPSPPPVTTIAWRLAHLIVEVFGTRNATHFGGPSIDVESFSFARHADAALAQLDEQYATWVAGVRSLGEGGLAQPCGPSEGPFASAPMAGLVLHINREVIHHGAEIALLRDLHHGHYGTPS